MVSKWIIIFPSYVSNLTITRNFVEIDYHMFTQKRSDSFYQNFIIILRPDFNILKIRSLPLGRGDKGWYPAGIRA